MVDEVLKPVSGGKFLKNTNTYLCLLIHVFLEFLKLNLKQLIILHI